jgi:hypothetical protein
VTTTQSVEKHIQQKKFAKLLWQKNNGSVLILGN